MASYGSGKSGKGGSCKNSTTKVKNVKSGDKIAPKKSGKSK